jgi:hypothetical protein
MHYFTYSFAATKAHAINASNATDAAAAAVVADNTLASASRMIGSGTVVLPLVVLFSGGVYKGGGVGAVGAVGTEVADACDAAATSVVRAVVACTDAPPCGNVSTNGVGDDGTASEGSCVID